MNDSPKVNALAMSQPSAPSEQFPATRLADYQPPSWRVDTVELIFDLGIESTEVQARLHLCRDGEQSLRLHGENLQLLELCLDDQPLDSNAYRYDGHILEIPGAMDGQVLSSRVRLQPAKNTTLEGLYLSGSPERGFLLTQCEAQGFRHITFFPDRPDVLARYQVELRADAQRFPVLLAGGNPQSSGPLADNRHYARFSDPHPRPSYLFALVAGELQCLEDHYTTSEGRSVQLRLWAESDAIGQLSYALGALRRSMRWDEETYGRCYDLDVFHVVATHDFNMGAMENKGLNIFNSKYLLADTETTTDAEFRSVEAVIGHEYFHNWSGNRVTCRDWFQLSLKEGFTVFREQSFSAAMHSPSLKRIEDVAMLRRTQFPEDAGPLAHPVRPAEYVEINNFYTATVYEKGAELIRMLAARLGAEGWRRGSDLYFARHDGQAATVEDLLAALGAANDLDLSHYLAWYDHAGTPHLRAEGHYQADARRYVLQLEQFYSLPDGQTTKTSLPIPVRMALFGPDGTRLPLRLEGEATVQGTERVLEMHASTAEYVFEDISAAPVLSLLRGLSAPVIVESTCKATDLALLLRHDPDGFNRWEAGQSLATAAFQEILHHQGGEKPALTAWKESLATLFHGQFDDPALLAELLQPPGEVELAEGLDEVDPGAIHKARLQLESELAQQLGAPILEQHYANLDALEEGAIDAPAQANRRLKHRLLELLCLKDRARGIACADNLYQHAHGMSDRLAALHCLIRSGADTAQAALASFRTRHADNPLVLDKWFAAQALTPGDAAVEVIQKLRSDPAFTLRNPNRVHALFGTWVRLNRFGFHRIDGAGYRLLTQTLGELDALNPQVAARLATTMNDWKRLESQRRVQAQMALQELAQQTTLSRNLRDILERILAV